MIRTLAAVLAVAFASQALAADAAATYKAKCALCHGQKGEGGKMAPEAIAGLPADTVKKAITEGKGKMKPVKIDNADDVAKFVSELKK